LSDVLQAAGLHSLLQRSETAIMGIINVTPDSFSDGGQALEVDAALTHGLQLVEEGADILDIGGESTRPGATEVPLSQELDRVIPVIEKLVAQTDTPISIDTYKPKVMIEAVKAGAQMVNDVKALQFEDALQTVSSLAVPVCLMHMHGEPSTMQDAPEYSDVVDEVTAFLKDRVDACINEGIPKKSIVLDPGIGFGKTLQHNLQLLAAMPKLNALGCNTLIGVSRKSMIDQLLNRAVDKRTAASVGLAVQAVLNGAKIVRVHDVRETYDAVRAAEAVAAI